MKTKHLAILPDSCSCSHVLKTHNPHTLISVNKCWAVPLARARTVLSNISDI